ncbi:MAG: hypothetical protein EHM72_15085 [Calditrichaeota bacterium]|nr:MAG: hypothetical protein EHM72_15085 [Calditrichota bacterium]
MKKGKSLHNQLAGLAAAGIQVNAPKLKRDMCSQFSDYNEWIREYVVNAADAGAQTCLIWGTEEGEVQSVHVADDGHGMNREGLLLFFTLYKSDKKESRRPVGRHGIGKLSVAAIPGQCGFSILTSNGKEAWRAETGSLLEETPITLERLEPVPDHGTTFCIQFKKKKSLHQMMHDLEQILEKYVSFLPLSIRILIPADEDKGKSEYWHEIGRHWEFGAAAFSQSHELVLQGNRFEVILSLEDGSHDIYQNRVFVTSKYNLLSFDLGQAWQIPHLAIRVDSPDFELPFGRHCLSNEEILRPLTRQIRTQLLPELLANMAPYFYRNDARGAIPEMEEIIAALCLCDADFSQNWTRWPILRLVNGSRLSFSDLTKLVRETGKIYIANEDEAGVDYSFFDGPVMSRQQPEKGLQVIEKTFAARLINLQQQDLVMEAPAGSGPELTQEENQFAQALGFHPEVLQGKMDEDDDDEDGHFNLVDEDKLDSTLQELKKAQADLQDITWRVSHLVERDGRTPCLRYRFLCRENEVILNLYHPDVQKLVKLAGELPLLAGHWAIAMCLTEETSILAHLSAEEREDILLVDAMAKLSEGQQRSRSRRRERTVDADAADLELWNFIRSAMDRHSLAN